MVRITEKKSQKATCVKLKETTKEALLKKCEEEDRTVSYIIEKALRKYLGLDK